MMCSFARVRWLSEYLYLEQFVTAGIWRVVGMPENLVMIGSWVRAFSSMGPTLTIYLLDISVLLLLFYFCCSLLIPILKLNPWACVLFNCFFV